MSMPALLSHFGINAARYVTTAGQIVFDGVTRDGSGYNHATLGRVSPVPQHTFHGGYDEPDDTLAETSLWWDNADEIGRHIDAMKTCFPAFTYFAGDNDHAPCWIGEINTGRGKFTVGIVLRRDRGLPSVSLINGPRLGVHAGRKWIPSEHLYLNGNLCVAGRDDWNPQEQTAATAAAWAAHWLAAYTEWRFTRRWPVEGVHSVAS